MAEPAIPPIRPGLIGAGPTPHRPAVHRLADRHVVIRRSASFAA
ncbi:hypothetical protein ABTZ99_05480 [Actinosynnema sp. NPDC002837]